MPHWNVWIRNKNLNKWNQISDKSDWINKQLEKTEEYNLCKNGHIIPEGRGGCFIKGCKFN